MLAIRNIHPDSEQGPQINFHRTADIKGSRLYGITSSESIGSAKVGLFQNLGEIA